MANLIVFIQPLLRLLSDLYYLQIHRESCNDRILFAIRFMSDKIVRRKTLDFFLKSRSTFKEEVFNFKRNVKKKEFKKEVVLNCLFLPPFLNV